MRVSIIAGSVVPHGQGLLLTEPVFVLAVLGALVLLFTTLCVTLANWRDLSWPWRLIGLLSVPVFVFLGIWLSRPMLIY
jgi:uncharacterized membrane protein YhaH (DUF805 family)